MIRCSSNTAGRLSACNIFTCHPVRIGNRAQRTTVLQVPLGELEALELIRRTCALWATTFQREAKAIPQLSGTDPAEISAPDRVDCDETRFAESRFWRMPQPALWSVAYPSEGPSIGE